MDYISIHVEGIMQPITREELLDVIAVNPMICTRAIVKKLRPTEFHDPKCYRMYLDGLKPMLFDLWQDGAIVSSKVQCCTFNLKQWQFVEN